MRARWLLACAVVAVAAVLTARGCATDAPPTGDAPERTAGDTDPARPTRDRSRTHVKRPERVVGHEEEQPAAADRAKAPLVDGEVPEENRGVGAESVTLRLVDAATEKTVRSRVRLWRLGVPADDVAPEGDHIQDEFQLPGDHVVNDLPTGRYRLEVWAAATGTEDPPEFVVHAGRENTFAARIELPGEVAMGLRAFDEHGVLLTNASCQRGGAGSSWGGVVDAPAWARPRTLRDRSGSGFTGRRGGSRTLSTGRSYRPVEAEHGVFDLGTIRRSGRASGWSRGFSFRFADRTDVRVRTRSRDADDGLTYVAVSVPLQPLLDSVRFPDGTHAAEAAGARVRVACDAQAAPPGDHSVWRTVPIRVTFELPEHEKLEFEWCVDDGTPVQRTLQPAANADR